uniref:Conserved plasma membrane protein n=1 Tax=Panagrellus redivivus TaxID=6233 RepID=A0A7E4W783_PANRE
MAETDRASDSSWSLVDVNDEFEESDASDVESLEGDFTVESVHDSASEAEEDEIAGYIPYVEEPYDAYLEEEDDGAEPIEDEYDVEEAEIANEAEESDVDGISESEYSESESDDEEVEVVAEDNEALLDTAAKHYIEPALIAKKLNELSNATETSIFSNDTDPSLKLQFYKGIACFLIMLIPIIAMVGLYAYEQSFKAGIQAEFDSLDFCSAWEQPSGDWSGLQYRAIAEDNLPSIASEDLDALRLQTDGNHIIRPSYRAKQASEVRSTLYKRASRQLSASKKSAEKVEEIRPASPKCGLNEVPVANLTRAIFSQVSNWTASVPVVKNLIHLSPSFDSGVKKVSSWLRSPGFSRIYAQVQKQLPPVWKESLQSMPKKFEKFAQNLRSDFTTYARKAVTTALAKTSNFSTKLAQYKRHPIVSKIGRQVRSALARWSKIAPKNKDVCFVELPCSGAGKFAGVLEKTNDLSNLIGRNRAKEYIAHLRSLAGSNNCSARTLACERDWWTGCGGSILSGCSLRQWQRKRVVSSTHFLTRRPELKSTAIEIGWIPTQDRRSAIRCARTSIPKKASPLPCAADNRPLPTIVDASMAPCQAVPFAAKPCHQSIRKKASIHKPRGNGRPDWFTERAAARAAHRQAKSTSGPVPPPPQAPRRRRV